MSRHNEHIEDEEKPGNGNHVDNTSFILATGQRHSSGEHVYQPSDFSMCILLTAYDAFHHPKSLTGNQLEHQLYSTVTLLKSTLGVPMPSGPSVHVEVEAKVYYETKLTTDELDLICGPYQCVNEQGQTSSKSWWPLARF
ncbi:hypothetical protein CC1G_12984 [Coprinopsis cinerea okayama7|uniref:Uncharacterized protein n=1 Tax=Coprinopsis cinerea (strain Okayama-7 / 130 / ATCC MYA-4618 / FGSC 9003) TaxID=240176 RepID=A8PHL1_COPC7|nr:hypothetical protein CC1G_12984 [Coprinopsis cinerea okayama7\|eukprot:XP_001841427.2 hypothetical protein CC1G_12984 [Coprinopsis cinerea okayama7\